MKIARCASLLFLLWSWSACHDDSTTDDAFYSEDALADNGPYAVGFQRTTLTYDAPGQEAPRTIPVLVWYPGVAHDDARRASFTLLGSVPIKDARAYAKLELNTNAPLPLAIYSHGSGGEGVLAYPYAQRLASRGWVVAAIDHVGNTTKDALSDSDYAEIQSSVHRPLDIQQLLDAAEQGFGFEGFDAQIDVQNTFMFGHSFGGFTSLLLGGATYQIEQAEARACHEDPTAAACVFLQDHAVRDAIEHGFRDERVRAIGLQAPSMMGVLDAQGVRVPTLMLTGDRDQTTTHLGASVPIWEGLSHDEDLWVRFADAGHFSFITVCDIFGAGVISSFEPSAPEDGCGLDFLPVQDVVRINAAYLTAFAEHHLLDIVQWAPFVLAEQHFRLQEDAELTLETHVSTPDLAQ